MNRFFYKRKGSMLFELCISAILLGLLFATFGPTSGTKVRSISDEITKDQTLVIDHALEIWHSSHSSKYPTTLTVLKDMDMISQAIDLNLFTYGVRNSESEYRLTTTLKNGSTYKSIGSKY